jgi:hypothetical protein
MTHLSESTGITRLQDSFGAALSEGDCVLDADHQIGYVRLELGPGIPGPASPYWDGWFNITRNRSDNPLKGKVANGILVQLVSRRAS